MSQHGNNRRNDLSAIVVDNHIAVYYFGCTAASSHDEFSTHLT